MDHLIRKTALASALAVLGGAAVAAPEAAVPDIRDALDVALVEVLAGEPPAERELLIEQAERQRIELGAVIDVRASDARGLPVLAITPGSAAARMGLAVGDLLQEVNGIAVASAGTPGALLQSALVEGDGELRLRVLRGGETLFLSGSADLVAIPAYKLIIAPSASRAPSGCGFVSGGARASDTVRKVEILSVDGKPADASFSGRVRLAAGSRRLVVRPKPLPVYAGIDGRAYYLESVPGPTGPQPVRRVNLPGAGFQDNAAGSAPVIEFELTVAPNTSYQLGARPTGSGGAMEAFVYKQSEKACQGG